MCGGSGIERIVVPGEGGNPNATVQPVVVGHLILETVPSEAALKGGSDGLVGEGGHGE